MCKGVDKIGTRRRNWVARYAEEELKNLASSGKQRFCGEIVLVRYAPDRRAMHDDIAKLAESRHPSLSACGIADLQNFSDQRDRSGLRGLQLISFSAFIQLSH